MYRKKSKKKQREQLFIIYSIMILAVVSIVSVLVMLTQGYRYNKYDGRIEQGGLVQFNSQPSGATVGVDNIILSGKTASKITLTSGDHDITMSRTGYNSWQKTVRVLPGSILWLNYSKLFPVEPKHETVLPDLLDSSAISSPDRSRVMLLADRSVPQLSEFTTNSESVSPTQYVLSASELTRTKDPRADRFDLVMWDNSGQRVILRHSFDKSQEFLMFDTQNSTTYNISNRLGLNVKKIEFSNTDRNVVYILTESGQLRRANLSSSTLSGPLANNVVDFSAFGQPVVTYRSASSDGTEQMVGYVSGGKPKSKQIEAVGAFEGLARIAAGKYFGENYLTIINGTMAHIYQVDLPASDSQSLPTLELVHSFAVTGKVDTVRFSPLSNRFVEVRYGEVVTIYDLELQQITTISDMLDQESRIQWVDAYHYVVDRGTSSTFYDFDGTNPQLVAESVAPGALVAESPNGKYIYYFTKPDKSGTALERIKLLN